MFELFFVIMLGDDTGFRERFDDQYLTISHEYKEQIIEKYPNIVSFDIECKGSKSKGNNEFI